MSCLISVIHGDYMNSKMKSSVGQYVSGFWKHDFFHLYKRQLRNNSFLSKIIFLFKIGFWKTCYGKIDCLLLYMEASEEE